MEIDNSRAQAFRLCPWFYYENYVRGGRGMQPIPKKGEGYGPLELGGRVHELLENYYKNQGILQGKTWQLVDYPQPDNHKLETETSWMLDAYHANYPNDNWEIIDVERTFRVALPGSHHVYIGKIDLFIRDLEDDHYWIIDHKTQKRGSKSHAPQKLAVSDQGSLYLWAARKLYDQVDGMKYNILVRPSDAGQEGPSFLDRYAIERGDDEIADAVRDITEVADHIEDYQRRFGDGSWPANRNECYGWTYCDYYRVHRYGEDVTLTLQHQYEPRGEYLYLEGVPLTP